MVKVRKVENFKKCCCCGEEKKVEDFYMSSSPLNRFDKRQHICKNCVVSLYNSLKDEYSDVRKSLYLVCQKVDAVYKSVYVNAAIEDSANRIASPVGSYFAKINSAVGLKNSTFENSDNEFQISQATDEELMELGYTITRDDITTWGKGYSNEEYERMNKIFREYCQEYGADNLTTKKVYISLVKAEITRDKALESGDTTSFQKLTELISKLMSDADLKPKELKGDSDKEDFSLGVFIDKWENDAPLPEISEEFKDVDKIERYFEKIFVKPFRKTLGIDNE